MPLSHLPGDSLAVPTDQARQAPYRGDPRRGEIELLKEQPIFRNTYVSVFNDSVRFPNGQDGQCFRWHWQAPYGVVALPRLPDGRIVLIELFRHTERAWRLEAPRGFGSAEETPDQAAARETEEETGFTVVASHRLRTLGSASYPSHLYLVDVIEQRSSRHEPDGPEQVAACHRFSPDQIPALLTDPRIHDAETLLMLAMSCHVPMGTSSPEA